MEAGWRMRANVPSGAREVAEAIVEDVHRSIGCAFTAFVDYRVLDGDVCAAAFAGEGERTAVQRWSELIGCPIPVPWDASRMSPRERGRFREIGPEGVRRLPIWDQGYEPAGLERSLRLLAYDGDTFVGWFGASQLMGGPGFSRQARRYLKAAAPRIVSALVARSRLQRGLSESSCLLVDERGRIEATSDAADEWLCAQDVSKSMILEAIRTEEEQVLLGGAVMRRVRMRGDGRTQWLCMFEALPRVRLSPLASLSRRQAEVVEFAAHGVTVKEIAAHSGCSAATVRVHLREAYRRLGVANRAELAAVVLGLDDSR